MLFGWKTQQVQVYPDSMENKSLAAASVSESEMIYIGRFWAEQLYCETCIRVEIFEIFRSNTQDNGRNVYH